MDVFEQEMTRKTIFKDRNVLSPHYVPEHLPYREKEMERMEKALAPALSGKRPNNLFIYGKTGTGKTATTRRVTQRLEEVREKYGANVQSMYINCRINNTKYQVLLKCAEELCEEHFMGHPANYLYEKILKKLDKQGMGFIVVLDEIDKVRDLDDLMYSLTRANDELNKGKLGLVGISNQVTFKEKLDPRSKSSLCQEEMVFAPYNAEQLNGILKERSIEGFRENCVEDSAIALASATAAKESGDARYALRLLLKAGELADDKGVCVSDEFVRKARSSVEEDVVLELISVLPDHQSVVLYAIASLVKQGSQYKRLGEESGEPTFFSGEVYEKYEGVCKKWQMSQRSARWFSEYLNELEMLGLVTTMLSGKGVRGNTKLIRLAMPADKVVSSVEKKFA